MSIEDERRRGEEGGPQAAARPSAAPRRGRLGVPVPLLAIAAALLVALAAYAAYWLVAVAQLEASVAGWIEDRRADGLHIEHGPIERSGFPGRLRLAIAPVEMAGPAGWRWQTSRLQVEADPLAPRALEFNASGVQEVRLPAALGSGDFVVEAPHLVADAVAGDGLAVGSGQGSDLTLRRSGSGEADSLRIGRVELGVTPGPSASASSAIAGYRVSLRAADITLPPGQPAPLGERIAGLSLLTEVTGEIPADARAMPWPNALARWRDDGGTIEVRGVSLEYGPLRLSGDGTLALDGAGEPVGAFSLKASGLPEALRMLAEKGIISPLVAAGAAFVFRPPQGKSDDGSAAIAFPASLQDRKLYLGPLAVGRIPSPPWVPLPATGS